MKMELTSTKSQIEQYSQHATSVKSEKRAVIKKEKVQMKEKEIYQTMEKGTNRQDERKYDTYRETCTKIEHRGYQ